MIRTSETTAKLMSAVRAVQMEIEGIAKDGKNPHYGSNYARLPAFLHALRGPLDKHGLTMIQSPGMADGRTTLTTRITHDTGEWLEVDAAAPMQKNDPQGVGSAVTYLRRYSLGALFAIPEEDDDGNAASGRNDGPPPGPPPTPMMTDAQEQLIRSLAKSSKLTKEEQTATTAWLDGGSITRDKASQMIDKLNEKIKAGEAGQ